MYPYAEQKDQIQVRLRRIEGQLRGVQRMLDEDKYCVDILTQLSSVVAATQKVGIMMLESHINGCVTQAIKSAESSDDSQVAIQELVEVVERFVRR